MALMAGLQLLVSSVTSIPVPSTVSGLRSLDCYTRTVEGAVGDRKLLDIIPYFPRIKWEYVGLNQDVVLFGCGLFPRVHMLETWSLQGSIKRWEGLLRGVA